MFKRFFRRGWSLMRTTVTGWWKDDGNLLSAATAYYAAFSLFPLCLVLIAGLGFVGRYSTFVHAEQRQLIHKVSENVSPWLAEELSGILAGVEARAMLGGPLGLLILVLAAIGIFTQLENIFARVWDSPNSGATGWWSVVRAALWDRLLAFLTLLGIGTLLFAVFFSNVVLTGVRPYLIQLPTGRSTWHIVQWLSTLGCDTLLLTIIYRVLPSARVRWRDALGGGLLAAVVWAIGRSVLLSLVLGEEYSAYGILGAIMGLMFWFYYASAVIFLGAEFAHALGLPKDNAAQPPS